MDLVIGDWIVQVTLHVEDISSQSAAWWRAALLRATQAYERWLTAPPMERLLVAPEVPQIFENGPWARIERRGALALLKALPEGIRMELVATRSMGLFAIFHLLQPGGLGERTALLKYWYKPRRQMRWESGSQPFETRRGAGACGGVFIQVPDPWQSCLWHPCPWIGSQWSWRKRQWRLHSDCEGCAAGGPSPKDAGSGKIHPGAVAEQIPRRRLELWTSANIENGGGESGSEKPELTPRSDPASGGGDGFQINGEGSRSEEPDATPSEEKGGGTDSD